MSLSVYPQVSSRSDEFSGTWPIDNASNSGTVTGLGIVDFVPSRAIVTVRIPSGGLVLFPVVVDGTITTDGFQFVLSGITDSGSYKLDFILKL